MNKMIKPGMQREQAAKKRLLISFSGGETSAFMAQWLVRSNSIREIYDEIITVFANTGQENEETLEFVQECDEAFGLNVVWVEADVQHGERVAPKARIVTFETASRNGEPFEQVIKKYGISNAAFPGCSVNLKRYPIQDYARQIGWGNDYDLAIGIRRDEIDRISEKYKERRIIYPLINMMPMTKPQINTWFAKQPFRLRLPGWKGNCKWCWKKSNRKLFTVMADDPDAFEFPERMEREYALHGHEFTKPGLPEGYRRTFFRGNRSVSDLRKEFKNLPPDWVPATDDATVFDPDWDTAGACGSESCEVFGGEDDDINFEAVIAEKRASGGKRGGAGLNKVIKLNIDYNPRRVGVHGWRSFEIVRNNPGITLGDYLKLGGRRNDLAWDIDHGWAELIESESNEN